MVVAIFALLLIVVGHSLHAFTPSMHDGHAASTDGTEHVARYCPKRAPADGTSTVENAVLAECAIAVVAQGTSCGAASPSRHRPAAPPVAASCAARPPEPPPPKVLSGI
jgi:hypothetical protein